MSSLGKARKLARQALESLYKGTCTVYEYQSVKDPITKITSTEEVVVLIDQPCKLSFKNITSVNQLDNVPNISQGVKLFIAPDIVIKAGSKITVTQNGVTTDYVRSSKPAVFSSHQEIILELYKDKA